MWLLYLDESGNPSEHKNFVLGGVAVFEGEIYKLTKELDRVAALAFPGSGQSRELHIRDLKTLAWSPKHEQFTRQWFFTVMANLADVIRNVSLYGLVLFGSVVHMPSVTPGNDPYVSAFEDVCSRFNMFLTRKHKRGDTQKGMVILDFSSHQHALRRVAAESRLTGDRWGHPWVNLPEAPMFIDSTASRLVQLSDFVAHALFRRYERGDTKDLDSILRRFDADDEGVIHGIGHVISKREECMCSACVSRPTRGAQGWYTQDDARLIP